MYVCGDICAADGMGKVPSARTGELVHGGGGGSNKENKDTNFTSHHHSATSTVLVCVYAYCTSVRDSSLRMRKVSKTRFHFELAQFTPLGTGKAFACQIRALYTSRL